MKEDYRKRVTRMLIRHAFTELLRNKPIQSISVKELCEQAGINRGTFYAHYTDIYDLLHKIEDEMLEDFTKTLSPLFGTDPRILTLKKIITEIFQCLKNNADICTVTLGPYGDKDFAARLLTIGQELCIETYTRMFANATRKQIEFCYAFISSGCIGLLEKWLAEGMLSSAEEMAEMADGLIRYGVDFLQNQNAHRHA